MPFLLAHRGASHLAPENTLAAFRLAQELGAHGFEFDVQRCASGELLVFHDRFPERTTNDREIRAQQPRKRPRRTITALPYAYLQALDAGSWKDRRFQGEKIPRFEEVLEAARDSDVLDVEIKTFRIRASGLEEAVLALLEKHGMRRRNVVVTSFNPFFLKRFRTLSRAYPIGLISEIKPKPNRARKIWVPILKPEYLMLQGHPKIALEVARYHRQGRKVFLWTLDTPQEFQLALDAGADGVITNRPELLRELPADIAKKFCR